MLLYSVFHLNLLYSSIEEESRAEVIDKCYYPLLSLSESGIPIGVEVTGLTLEAIQRIDPSWLTAFAKLLHSGRCELIGSGYAQIIGPLWPAVINAKNLEIGNQVYKELLGVTPAIALVNEQAYSAGLVEHYLNAGYDSIIMEWDNPFRYNREWNGNMRYFPQRALGSGGREIPVIWNHSISYQKFQRVAHADIDLETYLPYIRKQVDAASPGAYSIYGNDAEIFDYRPGRYHTEAPLIDKTEWSRIAELYDALRHMSGAEISLPSAALDLLEHPEAGKPIRLESPQQPIPVKKQEKYNIARWGLSGRGDLLVNTLCYQLCETLTAAPRASVSAWKELLYFTSSDFRTHITEKRWMGMKQRLSALLKQWPPSLSKQKTDCAMQPEETPIGVRKHNGFLDLQTESLAVRLNLRKGMCFDAIHFKTAGEKPLICTIPHGYFDDMAYGADFFSGHLVIEEMGRHKVTDLEAIEPKITHHQDRSTVSGKFSLSTGDVEKTITVYRDEPRIELTWESLKLHDRQGVVRLGHVTLNPEAFDRDALFFACHNGGSALEYFHPAKNCVVEHGRPVSFLVSASQAIGATEGTVLLGDLTNQLTVKIDKSKGAALGLMTFKDIFDSWFFRLTFSLQEFDDTSKPDQTPFKIDVPIRFSMSITHGNGMGTHKSK